MADQVVLSLGSNLGDRAENLKTAVEMLQEQFNTKIRKSPVYDTPPLYAYNQNNFYNCCVTFKSDLSPEKILLKTKAVEDNMGRLRDITMGPRVIDLDILFIGNKIIAQASLTVPHPDIQDRLFVLQPLYDILPEFVHPTFGLTVEEMLIDCPDESEIKRVRGFWKSK
ncbi:2-amino-4-hydroxy-6-hydroxymethyldihydropteridine diphosphokinase [Elusimicrobiota bacterium]